MWKDILLHVSLCALTISSAGADVGDACVTPNGENAICVTIHSCKVLYNALVSTNPDVLKFIQSSQCGYEETALVCCGSIAFYSENIKLLPDRNTCGFQLGENKIIGGEKASLDEFPWVALIRYRDEEKNREQFACGGTLISPRYVLTAAHCLTKTAFERAGKLQYVRFGEWDVESEIDCISVRNKSYCNDPPVNVEVEKMVLHSDYSTKTKHNDIALLRLKRSLEYTDFIRPVCLPFGTEEPKQGDVLQVAGWGAKTIFGNVQNTVKQKLSLPVVSNSDCVTKFRNVKFTLENSQLCAGGEANKDSCRGDSGGPLLNTNGDGAQYRIEGIVSFGVGCGIKGYPAVYTRVSQYVEWIVNNIEE